MSFRSLHFIFLALVLVSFSKELRAQTTTTGGLTGVVTDPSEAVVPDATIELKDSAKGTTLSTTTNAEGIYLFSLLLPKIYPYGGPSRFSNNKARCGRFVGNTRDPKHSARHRVGQQCS